MADSSKKNTQESSSNQESSSIQESSPIGCLARVFWMLVGNIALVISAIVIFKSNKGFSIATPDIVYWAIFVSLIIVRYIDIAKLNGVTASGEKATLKDWRRYVITLIFVSSIMWVCAHSFKLG